MNTRDTLFDVELCPELQFFRKVSAALDYMRRFQAPLETVERLYGVTASDIALFRSKYPDIDVG